MIDRLSDKIWKNSQFQQEFRDVLAAHLKSSLASGQTTQLEDDGYIERLAQSATILCQASDRMYREAAYRIAISLKEMDVLDSEAIDNLLYVVLSRMGNFPAISYLQGGENAPPKNLPFSTLIEANLKLDQNTIRLNEASSISLTDFQKSIWDVLTSGGSLAASAPTSAGKSFILQAFIRRFWSQDKKPRILYLVPTRALINQVSIELAEALKKDGNKDFELVTIPIAEDQDVPKNALSA